MNYTYKHSYRVEEKQLASLCVYNVGYQRCEPLHQWGPGIRDHYLIHHIMAGSGYYVVNDTIYHLHTGDTFLVYPYTQVTYYADEHDPWEYAWVGFSGTDVAPILQRTDFSKEQPIIHQEHLIDDIKNQLLSIYEVKGTSFTNAVEMTGRLYTTLSTFMKCARKKEERKDSLLTYAQKGIDYISSHYSYPISIEEIANHVGISRSHLFRAFQIYVNQSPKEYLTDIRINQACHLLETSQLSIAAIANSVGFEDGLYFSKSFKKRKGVSPLNYKKAL